MPPPITMARRSLGVSLLRHAGEAATEHLALAAEARPLLDGKAGRRHAATDFSGGAVGGEAGAGRCQPAELGEQRFAPHVGIARRGEAVEEQGVDACFHLCQHLRRLAPQQGQRDAAAVEMQAMKTGDDRWIAFQQFSAERRQFRPLAIEAREVAVAQGMLVDREVVQPRAGRCRFAEQLPGAEEIQPRAEAGFENREAAAHLPARGEVVSGEKNMAGLVEPAIQRPVGVAIVVAENGAIPEGRRRRYDGTQQLILPR
jgi:hypothetical protein